MSDNPFSPEFSAEFGNGGGTVVATPNPFSTEFNFQFLGQPANPTPVVIIVAAPHVNPNFTLSVYRTLVGKQSSRIRGRCF